MQLFDDKESGQTKAHQVQTVPSLIHIDDHSF